MSLLRNSLLCLFSACLATACNNQHTVYHSYQSLRNEGWAKSDTLSFQIPITDSVPTTFRLFAEVRNRSNYPYQNLYLFISQNLLDSTKWQTDTIAINMVDSTGRWLGNGWGSIYQSDRFIKSIHVNHPRSFALKVTHAMKVEKLNGINDIGIRIEKK